MTHLLDSFVLVRDCLLGCFFPLPCVLIMAMLLLLLLMVIIHNNASLKPWEHSSVKPEKHIKPKSVSGIYPALYSSPVLSCVLHWFYLPVWYGFFEHWVCQALHFVCWVHSYPDTAPSRLGGDFCREKHPPNIMIDHWTPSICDLSSISGNVQRLWYSLRTKTQESRFPEKAFNNFTQKQQQIHLHCMDSAKWKVFSF